MQRIGVVVIGLGHAWREHYSSIIEKIDELELVGTVDPAFSQREVFTGSPHGRWHVRTVREIPGEFIQSDVLPVILTPDHYSTIAELTHLGFRKVLCEKPLVSRVKEIPKVNGFVAHGLKLYAIDFYLPKVWGLGIARGLIRPEDPRYHWIRISDPHADTRTILGEIEGVGVQVVEAGDFGLPSIARRPYLAADKEIGGMILDLVTHACGPLVNTELLEEWRILDVSLSRLSEYVTGHLVPVRREGEVEMYVTALLEAGGIPIQFAFGKVPIGRGGLWSLQVRGKSGMYYAGLRMDQSAVLLGNDGRVVTFSPSITPCESVLREALLYFQGMLPGFDGNLGVFTTSMEVGQAVLRKYAERLA